MRTAIPLGLEKTVLNTIGQHLATTEGLALGSEGERERESDFQLAKVRAAKRDIKFQLAPTTVKPQSHHKMYREISLTHTREKNGLTAAVIHWPVGEVSTVGNLWTRVFHS